MVQERFTMKRKGLSVLGFFQEEKANDQTCCKPLWVSKFDPDWSVVLPARGDGVCRNYIYVAH